MAVAHVMARANWHTYQILTKRADRLPKLRDGKLRFAENLLISGGASVSRTGGMECRGSASSSEPRPRPISFGRAADGRPRSTRPSQHRLGDRRRRERARRSPDAIPRGSARSGTNAGPRRCRLLQAVGGRQKSKAGRLLDQRTYDEMPEIVREPIPSRSERLGSPRDSRPRSSRGRRSTPCRSCRSREALAIGDDSQAECVPCLAS